MERGVGVVESSWRCGTAGWVGGVDDGGEGVGLVVEAPVGVGAFAAPPACATFAALVPGSRAPPALGFAAVLFFPSRRRAGKEWFCDIIVYLIKSRTFRRERCFRS